MKVSFWGTGASEGWPALFCDCEACRTARALGELHTRSQVLVGDDTLLDFGPDTLAHAMKAGISLAGIRTVLITHSHSDHFYPADISVCASNYVPKMKLQPMTVFGNSVVAASIAQLKENTGKWTNIDNLLYREVKPFTWYDIPGGRVFPVRGIHMSSEECLLYVVEKEGRRVLYGCDSGLYPDETNEALRGMKLDLAIMECTMLDNPGSLGHTSFAELRKQKKILEDAGAITPETKIYISHMYHSSTNMMCKADIEAEVGSEGIRVATDGLTVDI